MGNYKLTLFAKYIPDGTKVYTEDCRYKKEFTLTRILPLKFSPNPNEKIPSEDAIENMIIPSGNNIFIFSGLEILLIDKLNTLDIYFNTMEELKEFVAKL